MIEVPEHHGGEPESERRRIALAPALLVGAPRSGTTWLQRMLLAHPDCCGGQESHFHAMHLPFAAELLPACRVIHLVRDSRAVAASLIRASREPWGRGWAPRTPEAAAQRWLECVEAAERFGGSAEDSQFLRVHYEALHGSATGELRRLLEFLGMSVPDRALEQLVEAGSGARLEAGFELRGDLRDRSTKEPAGFAGTGRRDGWRSTLGWRGERRVWSITQAAMGRLGYTRDGWAGEIGNA
jgi:hypothetical protein